MFTFIDKALHVEQVAVEAIAQSVATPFYVYSQTALEAQFSALSSSFTQVKPLICYAMKANSNQAVLKTFAKLGAGADVVSMGELKRALAAGILPQKIVFSGVGKTKEEIAFALEAGILCLNAESEPEVEAISQVAVALNKQAHVSFRVNPDVDAKTHAKIATGKSENKFGIPISTCLAAYNRAAKLPNILMHGIDAHIGSQITDLTPFEETFILLRETVLMLRAAGHNIQHIDVGGGLGIEYRKDNSPPPPVTNYAALVEKHLAPLNCQIVLEPGRWLVGNAGLLITKVIYVKEGEGKTFVIVDAAMNDLIRPTLYEAYHAIKPVLQNNDTLSKVDIVGPVCETGDYLAQNRDLPQVKSDDLLAVFSAGAYGAVQACTYNTRPLIAEVLVKDDSFAVIRQAMSVEEIIARDAVPAWL
jgi:diaminopimelate decarboxylase